MDNTTPTTKPADLRAYPTTQPTEPTRLVKTVRVADLADYVNRCLAESTQDYYTERAGLAHLIEKVLMDANAYAGFRFIDVDQDGECAQGAVDPSRRQYYVKSELR